MAVQRRVLCGDRSALNPALRISLQEEIREPVGKLACNENRCQSNNRPGSQRRCEFILVQKESNKARDQDCQDNTGSYFASPALLAALLSHRFLF